MVNVSIPYMDPMGNSIYNIYVEVSINDPQSGWFIMENPIEMHDLGVPPFMEAYFFLNGRY